MKVVLMGGGHGLSNLAKGFKDIDGVDLSIIVTSLDSGGHTGYLRSEFGVVGLGDLRNVLFSLINDESFLKEIFDYRFEKLHGTEKVSIGNLILISLYQQFLDYDKVIEYFRSKEKIKAKVYLSSNSPLILQAEYESGRKENNEHLIPKKNEKIKKISYIGEEKCNDKMLKAIKNADIIVLGPGSLYTSVGSVIMINSIKKAIKKSRAKIIYVCNLFMQEGETEDYFVHNHEEALQSIFEKKIDKVIINNEDVDKNIKNKKNLKEVKCSLIKDYYYFYPLLKYENEQVVHDAIKTASLILEAPNLDPLIEKDSE